MNFFLLERADFSLSNDIWVVALIFYCFREIRVFMVKKHFKPEFLENNKKINATTQISLDREKSALSNKKKVHLSIFYRSRYIQLRN